MYLLGLGLLLLALKALEIGPVAAWSWWVVLAPFAGAAAWWTWADLSGYTKRRAQDRIDQRKADRLAKQRESLGIHQRRR